MWRSRVAAITGIVVIAVAQACGGGGGHVAGVTTGKPGSGATRIWAFSDADLVAPPAAYAARLNASRADLCKTAESGSQPMQVSQAIASLEGVLARAAGPNALTQLAGTQVGKSAAQAETVAAAEIAKANPGGSLAALLIALRDEPNEARHLENAAVVATSLGYPQEALALLSAAANLAESGSPEMGIDRTARTLNNQAYALIRLGRWSEAAPLLRTAIGREPLLNEAQRNLAVALLCLGNTSAAANAKRSGERRNHLDDVGDPTQPQTFDPSEAFDVSQGQPVKLPEIAYPISLDQAAGSAPKFESEYMKRNAQAEALLTTSAPPDTGKKSALTINRTVRIEALAGNVRATPQLSSLYATWTADQQHLTDLIAKWNTDLGNEITACNNVSSTCINPWCSSALPSAHRVWLTSAREADKALRAWADAYSRFASGMAANLKDPIPHQGTLIGEQYWLMSNYTLLIESAYAWTYVIALDKGSCFDQVTDAPAETKDGGTASGPSCTDLIGGAGFSLDLEVIVINVSCEDVGVETHAPFAEGGVAEAGLFSSVSYKFKNGSTTLFAGTYAKTNEIGGLSAGAKGGLYLTLDQGGNMQDVGMRGESSIDQSHGPGSASVSGSDASWSFVGAADEE